MCVRPGCTWPGGPPVPLFFFFNDTATTEIYTLSLHDALPIPDRLFRHRGGPANLRRHARAPRCAVGSQYDVRIENREHRPTVSTPRGGEECVDDVSLTTQLDIRHQVRPLSFTHPVHPAAGTARQLPRGVWRAPDDRSDLVEGHG